MFSEAQKCVSVKVMMTFVHDYKEFAHGFFPQGRELWLSVEPQQSVLKVFDYTNIR